jgi:hypothetical protein
LGPTPSETLVPTPIPTLDPTEDPTMEPTLRPTAEPTFEPTPDPTGEPTITYRPVNLHIYKIYYANSYHLNKYMFTVERTNAGAVRISNSLFRTISKTNLRDLEPQNGESQRGTGNSVHTAMDKRGIKRHGSSRMCSLC